MESCHNLAFTWILLASAVHFLFLTLHSLMELSALALLLCRYCIPAQTKGRHVVLH